MKDSSFTNIVIKLILFLYLLINKLFLSSKVGEIESYQLVKIDRKNTLNNHYKFTVNKSQHCYQFGCYSF